MIENPWRNLFKGVAVVLISSAIGSLAALVVLGLLFHNGPDAPDLSEPLSYFGGAMLFTAPIVGLGLVLFGLPVDALLRRAEVRGPFVYALFGLLGGMVVLVVLQFIGWPDDKAWATICVTFGVITALTYWAIFRRRAVAT